MDYELKEDAAEMLKKMSLRNIEIGLGHCGQFWEYNQQNLKDEINKSILALMTWVTLISYITSLGFIES